MNKSRERSRSHECGGGGVDCRLLWIQKANSSSSVKVCRLPCASVAPFKYFGQQQYFEFSWRQSITLHPIMTTLPSRCGVGADLGIRPRSCLSTATATCTAVSCMLGLVFLISKIPAASHIVDALCRGLPLLDGSGRGFQRKG